MSENKLPASKMNPDALKNEINAKLAEQFGVQNLVVSSMNYQYSVNLQAIDSAKLNKEKIIDVIINYVSWQPGIARVFSMEKIGEIPLHSKLKEMFINGYFPRRCGQVQIIMEPHWIESFSTTGTTHGAWNPYDSHIPLLWYGWGIKPGKTNRETYMTDIAATLAAMLHIQMPSGCVGKPITEVMK
jgi:hypothetical protein